MKGTLAVSWGPFGGVYVARHRVSLGWVAVTYVPKVEIEDLMRAYLAMNETAQCRAPHCWSEYGTPCGTCPVETDETQADARS